MVRGIFVGMAGLGMLIALGVGLDPKSISVGAAPAKEVQSSELIAKIAPPAERGGFLHFEASFVAAQTGTVVRTLQMSLKPNETVAFSVPGYPDQLFRFTRAVDTIEVITSSAASRLGRLLS